MIAFSSNLFVPFLDLMEHLANLADSFVGLVKKKILHVVNRVKLANLPIT